MECLVKGCKNVRSKTTKFNGPICVACAEMLEAGIILEPGPTFIHQYVDRHMKMAEDFGKLVEANKVLIRGGSTTYKGKTYCFREIKPKADLIELNNCDSEEH